MFISEQLSSFVNKVKIDQVPQNVCQTAKDAILDCLGVAVAGAREPASVLIAEYVLALGGAHEATIIAKGMKTAPTEAALANATIAHILDFDDVSDSIGGHPTAVILPAILAVGERLQASGRQVLEAYITGFEVEAKLAKLVNFEHYDKGWHPTATLGVFGATAACAKLMQLDEERTSMAVGMAASMASGIKENFGTMTKPFQAGLASRNGVMATMLAQRGFTAKKSALEGKQGFFEVYNGPGKYRVEDLEKTLGNSWDLAHPGIDLKQYPCCGSTHPAVDAVIYLVNKFNVSPKEIDKIRVAIHPRRLAHTNRPRPQTSLEAKFSVQYAAAVAALNRWVALEDFYEEALRREDMKEMLDKTEAIPLPHEKWGMEHFAAEVDLTLKDGRCLHHRVEKAKGRGPQLALSEEELERKYLHCTTQVFSLETARRSLDMIKKIESLSAIGMLMNLLAAPE